MTHIREDLKALHAGAAQRLAHESEERRTELLVRIERWWPDVHDALTALYSPEQVALLEPRLLEIALEANLRRRAPLRRLDRERELRPDWFQSETMLGYAAYADRFAGDLDGVAERIDYLSELGVTYLHLMPLLQPRPGQDDGGYAVADYRQVRPDLGDMADLAELATDLRSAGISLVLDLVLNHVAAEHEWARRARAGEEKYRDYFYIYPDRTQPDAFEETLTDVFPDTAPGSFTWVEGTGWVWTTFNTYQWDLNWSNPEVFTEFADLVLYLANQGVEVLRLDAIAFTWKRLGTTCQNLPQVHALTQALRALARIAAPALAFKAEAIVGPHDLPAYLGRGERWGKVSDIAYHNALMVHTWSMLASRDVRLAAHALESLPATPSTTAWVTYLRCHDDIGWAIDDEVAAEVGIDAHAHRVFLADYYAGRFHGSQARGVDFQRDEATGEARTCGMAASLLGLEAAQEEDAAHPRGEDEPSAVDDVEGRIFLAHALILGWGGIPVIWQGDELAMTNDPDALLEHPEDTRWIHRPVMDWDLAQERHDVETPSGRAYRNVLHLVRTRKHLPQLHASCPAAIGEVVDPGVLPVVHRHPVGAMVGLYNVTDDFRPYPAGELAAEGIYGGVDRISGEKVHVEGDGMIWLAPYQAMWIAGM
ncbi:alpha-amylase family protein [Serinibacter salmoneus]|nr:alpha-amylase family protein [Serinibacter salmoneus]